MNKALKNIMFFLLSVCMLFGLCSCRLEESYKEFIIKDITDYKDEDYFSSERFDFARVDDVVIIPTINPGASEYTLWISAYSKSATEAIEIKNLQIKEEETIRLNRDVNQKFEFDEKSDSLYKGTISTKFTEEEVDVEDGIVFDLVVNIEVTKNGTSISKSITYEIEVKGYRSFVLPT